MFHPSSKSHSQYLSQSMCLIEGREGNVALVETLPGDKLFTEVVFVSSRHPGVALPSFWIAHGEVFPMTPLWPCTCSFDHPQRRQMAASKWCRDARQSLPLCFLKPYFPPYTSLPRWEAKPLAICNLRLCVTFQKHARAALELQTRTGTLNSAFALGALGWLDALHCLGKSRYTCFLAL